MKLLFIRHADPDYSIDSLTETGWKEAELLSERIVHVDVKDYYVSPLGRARDTASCTLTKVGRKAEVCEWLKEFPSRVLRPDQNGERNCAWDWLPKDLANEPKLLDARKWKDVKVLQEAQVGEEYDRVCERFDALLAEHGYIRDGLFYKVSQPNHDTLAFFCHFGLECVLLSHLMNVSPYTLWQGFCAPPSSVTTVYTEERREGIASFRAQTMGDVSHLYVAGREPSFAARFCECFMDTEDRHD